LALELGMTVEQVMQMSTIEIAGWAKYFEYCAEEQKSAKNS